MDYFDLLHQAQMNNKNVTVQETRCYKTSFAIPKKAEKSRVSSHNIKKFLARKEEEEKKKALDAQKKKEELLALRSMDKKAHKRVQTMLKRTKSANKSVMEDAIDNYNTKDTLEGPQQCDDDDYGYVSQEASALYEKLMAKYEKAPVENLKQMSREVKDLKAAKDRVKAALDREAEEQLHPTRKRKRKHEDGDLVTDKHEDDQEAHEKFEKTNEKLEKNVEKERETEKPKKIPKKIPPPVDFFELMKIAAKKQHEPIVIEKKVEEPERPMTMKEKMERQKELDRIDRKNRKSDPKNHNLTKPPLEKASSSREESSNKVQSKSKSSSDSSDPSKLRAILKGKNEADSQNSVPVLQSGQKQVKFSCKKQEGSCSPRQPLNKSLPVTSDKDKINKSQLKFKPQSGGPSKSLIPSTKNLKDKVQHDVQPPAEVDLSDIDKEIALLMKKRQQVMEASKAQKQKTLSNTSKDTDQKPSVQPKPSSVNKSIGFTPKKQSTSDRNESVSKIRDKDESTVKCVADRDKERVKSSVEKDKLNSKVLNEREKLQLKAGKVSDSKPPPQRRFSPPRYGPPTRPQSQMKKKPPNKRVIDSESEYDSEMDDFIDDGPEECMDYSRHIKEIFGYDKSRYSHVDEEECEEASYRTQMIEERRSAKIGLMEDLEDIQREKEEKARAKERLMKKKAAMKRVLEPCLLY